MISFEVSEISNGYLITAVDKNKKSTDVDGLVYIYAEEVDDILDTVKSYLEK